MGVRQAGKPKDVANEKIFINVKRNVDDALRRLVSLEKWRDSGSRGPLVDDSEFVATLTDGLITKISTEVSVAKMEEGGAVSIVSVAGLGAKVHSITADYTVTVDDFLILCDCTDGDIAITMPDVGDVDRRIFVVKKIDSSSNTVTISGDIDGETSIVLQDQYDYTMFQSNGTQYYIIGGNTMRVRIWDGTNEVRVTEDGGISYVKLEYRLDEIEEKLEEIREAVTSAPDREPMFT